MKILHTSDWHLGSSLYGQRRYEEFESFLSWLAKLIQKEQINILLVAGDIFDTSTPSNRALAIYYQFLYELTTIPNLYVIITAGNHDSPTLINAPQDLLKQLNIHVFGSIPENPEEEILTIHDENGEPSIIICAVPYLRDRDIRLSDPGENIEDKTRKLEIGVQDHYHQIVALAKAKKDKLGRNVPIIAMGHLFVAGGQIAEGDGVREMYVGNLARIRAETLCEGIDYFALGHLHVPQVVSGDDSIRYCGSPVALGFGDASQEKQVIVINFDTATPIIRTIAVPKFRDIRTLKGDITTIKNEIKILNTLDHPLWIEVLFSGALSASAVQSDLRNLTEGTNVLIIRTKPLETGNSVLKFEEDEISLEDLTEIDVFQRCLDANKVPIEEQQELMSVFSEIIHEINESDSMAE